MIKFLEKYSNKRNIILGISFILFINLIAFPYFPKLYGITVPLKNILDVKFGFSYQTVLQTLASFSAKEKHTYLLSTLIIDIPYALIYPLVYSLIIIALLKKLLLYEKYYKTALIPFFIGIFDLIENAGIIYFIKKFPHINPTVVKIISLANQLKWIFAILTLLIVALLLIFWSKNLLCRKFSKD